MNTSNRQTVDQRMLESADQRIRAGALKTPQDRLVATLGFREEFKLSLNQAPKIFRFYVKQAQAQLSN